MKILFVLDDFPPITFTGQSIVAYNLAQGLIKFGHEIFVITSVQDSKQEGVEVYNGIIIHRIYSRYPDRFRNLLSIFNPQTVFKFGKIIRSIKPDICHFHNVHDYLSYYCFRLGKRNSQAVFLTAHDMMLINYGKLNLKNGTCEYKVSFWDNLKNARKRYNPFRNLLIRYFLKYVDLIFCISNGQNEILKLNGLRRTATVHNAIDADAWIRDDLGVQSFKNKFGLAEKKIILFGARLSEAKGGEAILKAMQLIAGAVNNSVLVVVGKYDGYAEQMMELAKHKGVEDRIIFTDWLSRGEIRSAFFAADVCVTPSIYFDPFNLFNIEAMAAQKPVVGTCFGGTPEIVIDGETGYIVNPLKTEEFAARIIDLLEHPERAKKFGQRGYQRVINEFSLSGQVLQTINWYEKIINN